ncbi:glycosyl transferase family 2 [Gloeothece citriformis PCC 7424]|uniref:Glycosyl transferase family 2 n=1 Tax=Gloeothece citriformis (strain PCC 7424) TaxID=65393 RepID=B7KJG0_GLOC7|nr:glycosyltransferase family 2 protein [Gloeothece citriformis]ACK73637.1 glycosyl transferase family 2 [Gloeothece citriformis PCC 7424]
MEFYIEVIVYTLALLLFIPGFVLFLECSMAVVPLPSIPEQPDISSSIPPLNVLVPAHNEALVIAATLKSLIEEVPSPESIVVIADNCTDETATIAQKFGVKVIERTDPQNRGKGYALDFGLRFLSLNPPEVVIIVDADCNLEKGTIEQLARMAYERQKPVQATYIMEKPSNPKPQDIVSTLAFLIKNQVRSSGLARMGLPSLLVGTGMAFPWAVIEKVEWASGNLVEDMQLGIDLALAGYSPLFCPKAKVIGILPQQKQAATTQRTRWEHGHVQTLVTQVPRLLKAALVQKRFELLTLALEIGVPPLSLLVIILSLGLMVTAASGVLMGIWGPFWIVCLSGLLIFLAIGTGWFKFARKDIPATALLSIPLYLLWKIPLYIALLFNRETKWVRTEREPVISSEN